MKCRTRALAYSQDWALVGDTTVNLDVPNLCPYACKFPVLQILYIFTCLHTCNGKQSVIIHVDKINYLILSAGCEVCFLFG